MAPSLIKTVSAAAAVLAARAGATKSYQVSEVYDSTNFFDKFNFFSGIDPNGGFVQYQNQASAEKLGLAKIQDGEVYVGVDHADGYQVLTGGRKSVRLESKNVYTKGLIIADFTHLPKPVCGSWPAFWLFGDPWPTKGEIDLYENWNDLTFNRHTSHVDNPAVVGDCTLVASDMTAKIDSPNCFDFADGQANFQGCSASEFSSTFGSATGGIFALEWTDEFLKIWDWPRTDAPKDVLSGQPAPSSAWGQPSYMISKCNVDKAFKEMKMVLNVNFCGVAGQSNQWDSSCKAKTGFGTCPEYVAAKGGDFTDSSFKVKDIKVYELKEGQAQTSSSASSSSAISTSSSSASAISTVSTTSSVSTVSSASTTSSASAVSTVSASSSASVSVTSSASQSAASSTASEEDDSCTDDNGETSSSSIVSPTVSVSATTTESAGSYPTGEQEMTTSTIYSTSIHTITSCAPTVTNCPAGGYITTKIISVGTTVCPVTKTEGSETKPTPAPTSETPSQYTTSVVEVTNTYTITSCAATVTNCPVGSVTSEVTLTTTVCPVTKESSSPSVAPSVSSSKSVETPAVETPVSKPVENPGKPAESTSEEKKPETKTEVPETKTETKTGVVSTPKATTPSNSEAQPSPTDSSSATTITNGDSYVVVTPTALPASSINLGYNGTISTSFTSPTGAAGCKGVDCVIPVAGGVKTGASFTLMGVAAAFFYLW
ncbi:glycoside hydrolase family 16 protein [Daldinia sp. FL1419]|nr:glycoside hydrolase family 16 protein [Daldinia sp. FL1419]